MTNNIIRSKQEYNNDPRDKYGELPVGIKLRNIILIVAAAIYGVAMFLPMTYQRVYDASIVFYGNMLSIGAYAVSFTERIFESFTVGAVLNMFSIVPVVMTFSFLVSSIKNLIKFREGDSSLLGRNIFFLLAIPVSYLFVFGNLSTFYNSSMSGIIDTPFIVVVVTGVIAAILSFVLTIGKHRASILHILAIILAVVSFAAICYCMQKPVFDISYEDSGIEMGFELNFESFEKFYEARQLSSYKKNLFKKGILRVCTGEDGVVDICNRGSIVSVLTTTVGEYVPSMMVISAVAMAMSACFVLLILVARAFSSGTKKYGIIISKVFLGISTSAFALSLVQILAALEDVKEWLYPIEAIPNIVVNPRFHTLTFSVAIYPVIMIAAAILVLLLNVRRNNDRKRA